jgi:transcriptional regulator with XRE-family HTH domain
LDVVFRNATPIGQTLRKLRKERQASVLLLCQYLHVSQRELAYMETGQRPISLRDIQRLDRVLKANGRLLKVACEAIWHYARPEGDPDRPQVMSHVRP